MGFNISIEVDASKAAPTIKQVGDALDRAEKQGKAAGKAATDGMNAATVSAEKARAATDKLAASMGSIYKAIQIDKLMQAGKAFEGLSAQLAREAEMLDRINGPAREFAQNLQALEMLHRKGQVTAAQYAVELQRIKEASGPSMQLNNGMRPDGKIAGAAKEVASGANELMSEAGITGLGSIATTATAAVGALALGLVHLGDRYIELQNTAQKFADGQHDVDTVLTDQLSLSVQLHASLGSTMELYDAVRDGTDELGLSYEHQIRLTRELGEATTLAGRGIEGAAGIAETLSYAMAAGSISGRELKGVMKQVPEIADLLSAKFGKSRAELVAMANQGKITSQDLIDAFDKAGDALDAKMNKRLETTSEKWQHVKDSAAVAGGGIAGFFYDLSGAQQSDAITKALQQQTVEVGKQVELHNSAASEVERTVRGLNASVDLIMQMNGLAATYNTIALKRNEIQDNFHKQQQDLVVQIKAIDELYQGQVNNALHGITSGHFTDENGNQRDQNLLALRQKEYDLKNELAKVQDPTMARAIDISAQAQHARDGIEAMTQAIRTHTGDVRAAEAALRQYREELRTAYGDGGTDYVKQQLEAIRQPTIDYRGQVAALDSLLKTHVITVEQYANQLKRITDAYGSTQLRELLTLGGGAKQEQLVTGTGRAPRDVAQDPLDTIFGRTTMGGSGSQWDEFLPDSATAMAIKKSRQDALDKYDESVSGKLAELNASHASERELGSGGGTSEMEQMLERIKAPLNDYVRQMREVDQLYAEGDISTAQYTAEVGKLRAAYLEASGAAHTFEGGLERGWDKIKSQIHDVGSLVEKTMNDVFTGVETTLADLITKGKADWSSFLMQIANDLARLAIRQGMLALLGGGGGGDVLTPIGKAVGGGLAGGFGGGMGAGAGVGSAPTAPDVPVPEGGGERLRSGGGGGGVTVHIHQDPAALLPALDRQDARRKIVRIVTRGTPPPRRG